MRLLKSLGRSHILPGSANNIHEYTAKKHTGFSTSAAGLLPGSHQADIRMCSHLLLRLDDNIFRELMPEFTEVMQFDEANNRFDAT